MDATETANLRIPAILLPSYNNVIKTPSGRADLKRISVRCGVCRLLRYYSLTRGITRINRVAACEACRHCYQAYKREPVPLHCTKGDGSCWRNLMFPKTKCRCCWVTQMVERTPMSQQLYMKIMPLLPEYIRGELRGRPILASSLTMAERGFLTLEVHTGTDWRDVTLEQAVIQQRMNLADYYNSLEDDAGPDSDAVESTSTDQQEESNVDSSNCLKSSSAGGGSAAGGTDDRLAALSADIPGSGGSSSSLGGGGGEGGGDGSSSGSAGGMAIPRPPVKSVATRGKRGVKFRGSSFSSGFQSRLSGVSTADSDENSSASENQLKSFGVPRSKATKGTRGSRRGRPKLGQSKVDRVMAGIKEGLYGLSMSEESSGGRRPADSLGMRPDGPSSAFTSGIASSNTTSDSSGPNSGAASPTPMDEDVTVEEFEESSILRSPPAPVITEMAPPKNRDKKLPPDPMIGLLHDEQKKYLKDFNPRNSARVRRKKDRLEYLDNPRTAKAMETLVHDHKGRFVGADRQLHDTCDCLQLDCPGCHFPCPKCRSTKCGAECRTSRKWFYERVDVEGTEQFFVNRFIKV